MFLRMATLMDMRQSPGLDAGMLGVGKLTSLPQLERGRGARSNPAHRFDSVERSFLDDG